MYLAKLPAQVYTSFRPCPSLSCYNNVDRLLVLELESGKRPLPDETPRNPDKGPFFPRVLKVTVFPSVREPLEGESRLQQEAFLEILLKFVDLNLFGNFCYSTCTRLQPSGGLELEFELPATSLTRFRPR